MKSLHLIPQRLADAHFDFVVVGSYASVLHGSSFITTDIDICALVSPRNIARLHAILPELRPTQRTDHRSLSFYIHETSPGRPGLSAETDDGILGVLSTIKGVGDFARLRQKAIDITLFGRICPLISLEDLIASKEAVGREKDLLAVKELRAIAAKRAQLP